MKKSKIVVFAFVLMFGFVAKDLAQNEKKWKTLSPVRINRKYPTVYLTFERIRKVIGTEQEERIWLRLHNNARWGIRTEASGEDKALGDAKLYFDILSDRETLKKSFGCHVCSITTLGPGKSILFSLPREYLSGAFALRINFSYEWEDDTDLFPMHEPTHFVFFYSRDLPKTPTDSGN